MSDFRQLAEEIIASSWKNSPIAATFAGIHDHDHELDDIDRDRLAAVNSERKRFLDRLGSLNQDALGPDDRIDHLLLCNYLRSSIKEFEDVRYWQKNPADYANSCIDAVHVLLLREFAPLEERAAAILSRMEQIPRFLRDAKRNLDDTPRVFTRLAIDINAGGRNFIDKMTTELGSRVPALARDLDATRGRALAAMTDYARYLEKEILPRATGTFAVGAEHYNFKLKTDHVLPYTAGELLEYGQNIKERTERELEQAARHIDPDRTWIELVEDIKNLHPRAPDLAAAYKREMERARQFIRDHDLVTLPRDEALEVIPTPEFLRPTLPYAAYMNPAPFEEQQKGFFFVTPVDERLPLDRQEEILRGHPSCGIPVIALHEGYPGHHLQLVHANRVRSRLRRLLGTTVFIEGWALYCEEMMYDAGFYSDPRSRLLQLKDQLWRACRVIIDVGLHTGNMTFEQAVDLLVDGAKLQRVHAEKEVTRYTFTPTQPMSYLVGKRQIVELRRDYQNKAGADFNLKKFHDLILGFGSIPVCLIRQALGI